MSIAVKNIGFETPLMWSIVGSFGNGFLEAAPYYTGIRIKMKVDGTRTKTAFGHTTTHVLDYEIERTFTRVPMAFGSSPSSGASGGLGGPDDLSIPDLMFYTLPTGSDCYILVTPEAFGANLGSPEYQTMRFILPIPDEPVETVIGTYEYDGVTDDLKNSTDWWPLAPFFFHATPPIPPDRLLVDRWGITEFRSFDGVGGPLISDNPREASIAAPSSFRDLRGIQSVTLADPSGGDWDSSSVSYLYEWEIF